MSQIDKSSPQWMIYDVLAKQFETDPDNWFTLDELTGLVPDIPKGRIKAFVEGFEKQGLVDVVYNVMSPAKYRMSTNGFNKWIEHQESE